MSNHKELLSVDNREIEKRKEHKKHYINYRYVFSYRCFLFPLQSSVTCLNFSVK